MTAGAGATGFVTLTALVDGHCIAVQRDAVRVIEEECVGDKQATRVTLCDGTQFVIRETIHQALELLQLTPKTKPEKKK